LLHEGVADHRLQSHRIASRRVTRQENEPTLPGRQFGAERQQARQVPAQSPDFAPRAVPVARRVEDHGVITAASLHLASGELQGIFADPADWGVGQAGKLGVSPGPNDDVARGIDVRHLRPSRRARQRAAAGVREQVQHPDRLSGRSDLAGQPVPVVGLFGKQAHVARFGELQLKDHRLVANRPALWHVASQIPSPRVRARAGEPRVGGLRKLQVRTRRVLRTGAGAIKA
jgi:hypothetical protein